MKTTAKVIEDSNFNNMRLTTLELNFPRVCLSQFNTHRVFSRNTSSSRAIPTWKLIKEVRQNMFVPSYWGKNQSGMQAKQELGRFRRFVCRNLWKLAGHTACNIAWLMMKFGLHKQLTNRIIEPFSWTKVIVSSTEWENYLTLRNHPDAQPEIKELAECVEKALKNSVPKTLKNDEWHLPYVTEQEREKYPLFTCIKISVARCARVSYKTTDGRVSIIEKDSKLYDRLVGSVPIHASPAEHQAVGLTSKVYEKYQGNFKGFCQFRKILEAKMNGESNKLISSIFDFKRI